MRSPAPSPLSHSCPLCTLGAAGVLRSECRVIPACNECGCTAIKFCRAVPSGVDGREGGSAPRRGCFVYQGRVILLFLISKRVTDLVRPITANEIFCETLLISENLKFVFLRFRSELNCTLSPPCVGLELCKKKKKKKKKKKEEENRIC